MVEREERERSRREREIEKREREIEEWAVLSRNSTNIKKKAKYASKNPQKYVFLRSVASQS
jgi:hypothetical protein